jgi:hypothetical protein
MSIPNSRSIPVEYIKECFEYREEVVDGVLQGNVYWKHRKDMVSTWVEKDSRKKAGTLSGPGYYDISITYNGKECKMRLHIIVWILNKGRYPHDNMVMDHIDRNKLNNTIENLREIYFYQNCLNRGPSDNKSSAYKGVSYNYRCNSWVAAVAKGKETFTKHVKDEIEAALLYNQEAVKLHGSEYVYLNDISNGYTNKEYPNMPRHWVPEKVAA